MKTNKYNPSHKKVNLAGKIVRIGTDDPMQLKPKLNAPELLQHFLFTHAKPGDWFSIVLELKRPTRSKSQNSFYHMYLDLISVSTGHSMEELKAWVREHILGKGITEVFGTQTRIVGSSANLNMSEFVEMMNTIEEKTGMPIPDPAPFNLPLTYDEYGKLKNAQKQTYKQLKSKNIEI